MAKSLSKTDVNFWLDSFLLLAFSVLCWTSVVVRFVFPAGTEADGWTLWGWNYDDWAGFQFATVCVLAGAVVLHVMLHWSWVCGVVAGRLRRTTGGPRAARDDASRTLWGVGLLIAIFNVIGLGVAAAALTVQGPTP
ncbi:MAG: hypothetical protein DCC67_04140 [Planctomycetota bacterium]|nr:MAG: hypothetical protein DCC67_04140 [Planctomycetota bacterium]